MKRSGSDDECRTATESIDDGVSGKWVAMIPASETIQLKNKGGKAK